MPADLPREARPRIALYMRALYNGGTELVMSNLAHEFSRLGLPVTFLVDVHNPFSPFLKRLPGTVEYVPLGAVGPIARLFKLWRYLKTHRVDALISAGYFPNIVAILARIPSGRPTRVIVTEHNSPSANQRLASAWNPTRWFGYFARVFYRFAHGIVAVSNGTADDLARMTRVHRSRITTIYNPVVDERLFQASREAVDHEWFTEPHVPVVISVGRLEAQKNFASLIRAVSIVRKTRPCRLLIFGDGAEQHALERLILELGMSDHVRLMGFVENPHKYVARSSVLVLSSIWEGLSCVLIEALALGTPVVATDCPFGPSEVLDNGKFGKLVPVNDDQALADAILSTLDNSARAVPIGWLQQFTVTAAAQKYIALASG